ncbi:hypothetical protein BBL_2369 [Burkholderia pseudomallei MSHR1328]|nr:hypothetical protein Y042_2245 [Burkholderia pseudomallei MSHR1357]KKC14494.1 hypothetical protein BBL_2369 [Burkholderia pseudomallei MSHR1328]
MVDLDDLKDSGRFACAKLIGELPLGFSFATTGDHTFICVESLDSALDRT